MTTLAELHARAWKFTLAGTLSPHRALELAAVEMIDEARAAMPPSTVAEPEGAEGIGS